MPEVNTKNDYQVIKNKALKLMSIRMHTRKELSVKLLRKFSKEGSQKIIEEVLKRFEELKILNDELFAEIFLGNLIKHKTFGYYGVLMKLKNRGIEDGLARRFLGKSLTSDVELSIGLSFVRRKRMFDPQKVAASLVRKGFRTETISKIIRNLDKERMNIV